jgi:thymidylate synthase
MSTPRNCHGTWRLMTELTQGGQLVRNFHQDILMEDWLIETELFPREALEAYTAWNLGHELRPEQRRWFSEQRGGGQGDYREGMREKIDNVVDCLTRFPASKRAVITIANNPRPSHVSDGDAKCMRELHFHREGDALNATVLFRSQAALIFPKNIHFIGSLMAEVGKRLPGQPRPGRLFYLASVLVADRQ